MSDVKITELVTVEREVTGMIRDLVLFVRYVDEETKTAIEDLTNEQLVVMARDFWEREHGE